MSARNSRRTVLAILLTAAVLTGGLAGVTFAETPTTTDAQTTESPDDEDVIDSFVDRLSSLETVQFTRTTRSTFDNETTTVRAHVEADVEDGRKRVETTGLDARSNRTMLVNESTIRVYDATDNTISEYENRGTTVLPTIQPLANESLLTYSFQGTETVEGTETYVLEATPERDGAADGGTSVTLHVDTETYFPVRIESGTTTAGKTFSSTTTFENVTLDEGIPNSTFTLDVPENATEPSETVGSNVSTYDSRDELAAETELSVPDPEIPDRFSFERGTIVDSGDYHRLTLRYTDGNSSFSLNARSEPIGGYDYNDSDRYETVEIGDVTGHRHATEDITVLHWEDGRSYSLYGEIGSETAMNVAESIVGE